MQPNDALNAEQDLVDQLHAIVDEMLAPFGKTSPRGTIGLLGPSAPFDYTKPNQHDKKADFVREYDLVKAAHSSARDLLDVFLKNRDDPDLEQTRAFLKDAISSKLSRSAPTAPLEAPHDIVRRMVADTNGCNSSVWVIFDFLVALKDRLKELEQERDRFWSVPHRAPDYYARAIAYRLAKLYARETGRRPTSGASGVTGGASTGYTKALQKVFDLLNIDSQVRSPADWAVKNLTDDDLKPPQSAFASAFGHPGRPQNRLAEISALLNESET